MPDDGMGIPKHIALCIYTLTHKCFKVTETCTGTWIRIRNAKYSLSVPLDYWNSQQAGIGSCSAQPSHWQDTETGNNLNINQSQKIEIKGEIHITASSYFVEQKATIITFLFLLNWTFFDPL